MFPHGRRDSQESEMSPIEEEEEHLILYPSDDDQDPSGSQRSDTHELSSTTESHGRESPIELFIDAGEKVEVILGKIGGDINRALSAKRHRLETTTKESCEGIDQKLKQVWKSHEDAMEKLNDESAQLFINLFEQWNSDFQKLREQCDKLKSEFQQEEAVFQQSRFIQNQRLKTIKQVHEQFLKNLEDLEKKNDNMLISIQSEIKREMNKLRKKILRESQQQEMANVRQSLQSVLI